MGKKELSGRKNWQEEGETKANVAEQNLYEAFKEAFKGTDYILHEKPKHLKDLYTRVILPNEVIERIYNPEIDLETTHWGISPDFAIENVVTGKILFGEIKRQDGWVEGKESSAGRGNAHERLCKLFTPGLLNALRKVGGITNPEVLPFWVVFEGDITRDPKRNREIAYWFQSFSKNYFMWLPNMTNEDLVGYFYENLREYLD